MSEDGIQWSGRRDRWVWHRVMLVWIFCRGRFWVRHWCVIFRYALFPLSLELLELDNWLPENAHHPLVRINHQLFAHRKIRQLPIGDRIMLPSRFSGILSIVMSTYQGQLVESHDKTIEPDGRIHLPCECLRYECFRVLHLFTLAWCAT